MVLDRVTRSLLIGGDWRRQGCVLGGVLNRVYRCPRLGYRQGAGHMEQLDWPTHTDNQRHLYTHTQQKNLPVTVADTVLQSSIPCVSDFTQTSLGYSLLTFNMGHSVEATGQGIMY